LGLCSLGACAGLLPERGWKVDVLNGDRRLILSIATERSASMWLIEPDAHVALFREEEARPGAIELIDPIDCALYDRALLLPSSFTIVPERFNGPPLDFEVKLLPGATAEGPIDVDYTTHCSG
jgi:hypothetical protein